MSRLSKRTESRSSTMRSEGDALSQAQGAQTRAARPDVSAWVSANAGSGKTRVLTHRVARLLLAGADPSRILCLTYTKAAAAEMQNRLFAMLGEWAMAEQDALSHEIDKLLAEGEASPGPEALAEARRLFARALETPGGLRIQTIHAFCESLLSRFPLEAGVSPHFDVVDDDMAEEMIREARDEAVTAAMAEDPQLAPALNHVMARLKESSFDDLIQAIRSRRSAYEAAAGPDAEARLAAFLGADARLSAADLLQDWYGRFDRDGLTRMADSFGRSDKKTMQDAASRLREAARRDDPRRCYLAVSSAVMTQAGSPKIKGFPTNDVKDADPGLEPRLRALQTEIDDLRKALNAAERFEASRAAARLAAAVLTGYRARKAARAGLDYDDLIESAVGLLTRSDARDWVRFKLDGGVEHILVDEAQDTSPNQWRAIEALAEEFFAGDGVEREDDSGRPTLRRTIFAVGDEKQSIYSFQGAAPELLSQKGAAFEAQVNAGLDRDAPKRFEHVSMGVSFRSAPAVLGFVDAVFEPEEARKGLSFGAGDSDSDDDGGGATVRHTAFRADAPGRVDLWPRVAPADKSEEPPWDAPVDAPPPDNPRSRLAEMLAKEITGWIGREPLPARGRNIRAGDVLVLLRKRDPFSGLIIKALKALGAPVAGADRLSLTEELAARDMMALARFCLAPDDDLAVATLLRSPFCDVDEEGLFQLAHHRPGRRRLFYELQERRGERPAFEAAYGFLSAMLRRADFERPYELFAHALGPLDGRRRLVARLGAEAEDAIDELLGEALRFERGGGPTLEAFALRMAQREIEIKREHEQGRDEIRVMTAHGAKGLEAPVVVLPDTCGAASGGGRTGPTLLDPRLTAGDGAPPPIWVGKSSDDPEALAALRQRVAEKEAEEHRRLLYVALTRAEDRLLICGAGAKAPEGSWYALCSAAFESGRDWGPLGRIERFESPINAEDGAAPKGYRLIGAGEPGEPEAAIQERAPERERAPDWFWRDAATETAPADIRPSDLGGDDGERLDPAEEPGAGWPRQGGSGLEAGRAKSRGVLIHRMLERLPALAETARREAARQILAQEGAASEAWAENAIEEALGVLNDPQLAHLFASGSRAEVPFAAILPELGPGEIHGVIDRLVVGAETVLVVDFKSGGVPDAPPEPYLRQLALYREAVRSLFPGRKIETALLWTAARKLEHISASEIDAALGRASAALDPLRGDL